jgi:hypothetical protein
MATELTDRRRVRFRSAPAMRQRLGQEWPGIFSPEVLEAMRLELETLPWDECADGTLAWAGEFADVGARRLRRILDPSAQQTIVHNHLVRGRTILERLRHRPP